MRLRVPSPLARAIVIGICMVSVCAVAYPAEPRAPSILHLISEGTIAGELRGSDKPNVLRWQSPFFAGPFEFSWNAVNAVHYAVAGPQPRPDGEYGFELVDDDILYGNLLGVNDNDVDVESARLGKVRLRREQVRRIYRTSGADSIYLGPNGLAGWTEAAAPPLWRDEGGQLFTDKSGATLFADLGIPEKAVIELELSWKKKPDFLLAFGVNSNEATQGEAFHLEVWDNDLVAVGASARDADLASFQQLEAGPGYVRLQMYLDQKQRRLIVLSHGGKPLANLQIASKKQAQNMPGVRLTNKKGDVRLEYLRITRWNGLPPHEVRADQLRVHRTDGSIVYGRLAGFDPKTRTFTIRDADAEKTLSQDAIADIFLSPTQTTGKTVPAPEPQRTLRLIYRDGSRLSGAIARVENGHLWLTSPGVSPLGVRGEGDGSREPSGNAGLRLPLANLRSIVVLRHEPGPTAPPPAGRPGRLELEGVNLQGRLTGGHEERDASCIVWRPDLGRNACALVPGASGRVVYKEPPLPQPATPEPAEPAPQNLFNRVIANLRSGAAARPAPAVGKPMLHLRSGDTIPCEVRRITEEGVEFKTPLSDATFVGHEKIKSVDLIAANEAPKLDETKRDRLLMLPRLLKDSPPTHLICSKNGDFLRGRILEMDDKALKVEVRLETRAIPRERVAQIIWFHADEWSDGKTPKPAGAVPRSTRVQAMRADGIRLTFRAEKADGQAISGTSDVLGACRAEFTELDQLLFGSHIEESAAKLAHHLWKMHPAPEPKFTKADGAAEAVATGTESPLVGQPAFAFQLDMLDGRPFKLAEHKGKVVIVEFWATWCGPCLQSMPLIDAVAREFAGRGVELVAVNMEEQPEKIKPVLERHKLKVPVVLDRDGTAAARYAVTAIPQTVVVGRDGKVARLFVGGGKQTAESLRQALEELCSGVNEKK